MNAVSLCRYDEFVVVKDANNLIPIPDSMPLDIAALLPCGALCAYAAVQRAKPFVEQALAATNGQLTYYVQSGPNNTIQFNRFKSLKAAKRTIELILTIHLS